MLKAIAKQFELEESSISVRKIRRLKLALIVSLVIWPAMIFMDQKIVSSQTSIFICLACILVGSIGLLVLATSRLVNRLYFPNSYLDEWEIEIKRNSMTWAFQIILWFVFPAIVFLSVFGVFDMTATVRSSPISLPIFIGFMTAVYLQTAHVLWHVTPIAEDVMEKQPVDKTKFRIGVAAVVLSFGAFFVATLSGMGAGWKIAQLTAKAELVCETRGSTIKWVSRRDELGFACQDETRDAPRDR